MKIGKGLIVGIVVGLTVAVAAPIGAMSLMPKGPKHDALIGDDFYAIRREALALFPRGSRVREVADQLKAIGFVCDGIAHKMANVNAESLICESRGRGYPTSQAMNVTIMARNGLLSDIEIWNMLQRADAETPAPTPRPPVVAAEEPAKHSQAE